MKNDKQAAKGVSQLPGAPTAADPRYQARGTDMTTEGSSQDNGHLESPEAEWINTLLDDFTYSGRDGSDYGTDDAKEDRKWLKQAILTKLTEARISEAHECLLNLEDNQECTTCYSNITKVQDHIEQLKASKEDS
jgi:hypothetical protein